MTAPVITPIPAPPIRSDAPADFASKADAFAAALPTLVTQTNASAAFVDEQAISALSSKNAAAASELSASNSASTATAKAGEATIARNEAVAARDEAVQISANMTEQAGFPPLIGNAGKSLVVNTNESGVQWASVVPFDDSKVLAQSQAIALSF